MSYRSSFLVLWVACVCSMPTVVVRAQQAPPVDAKAVLATLKDLRTKQTGIINKEKSGVLAAINAAIADPGKAYEQALAATEPRSVGASEPTRPADTRAGGRPGAAQESNRMAETRKRLNDQLRDRDFVSGLRLQLVYLSLTWQRSMGVKTKDLLTPLLDYTREVNNNADTLQPLDMAKKSLDESVFVNYFQVGPYIKGLVDWSDHPFDTDSIFQKTILPELRKNKDPRLLGYWDSHLQSEATKAKESQNNLAITKFDHVRRPSLLWGRAQDEQVLGNTNQAVADMLAVLKANPDHPDFDKWATELEGVVSPKADPIPAGDVTVGPAVTTTPAPGPAGAAVPPRP